MHCLYLRPRGFVGLGERGKVNGSERREFGTPLSYTSLVVTACVTYVLSKFIATSGNISLDQPEYWLLALVPLILIHLVARFSGAGLPEECAFHRI